VEALFEGKTEDEEREIERRAGAAFVADVLVALWRLSGGQ